MPKHVALLPGCCIGSPFCLEYNLDPTFLALAFQPLPSPLCLCLPSLAPPFTLIQTLWPLSYFWNKLSKLLPGIWSLHYLFSGEAFSP